MPKGDKKKALDNENILEGILLDDRNDSIPDEVENFDAVDFIMKDQRTVQEFKENFDQKILSYLKESEKGTKSVSLLYGNKAELREVISVAQKIALKYVLLKPDDGSNEYKELKEFISDADSYIDTIIAKENSKLEEKDALNLAAKDFKLDGVNIYSYDLKKYDDYLNEKIDRGLPITVIAKENGLNKTLRPFVEKYNELRKKDENSQETKEAFENLEREIFLAKQKVNELYKEGLVSDDYVEARFERLDNYELKLPKLYEADAKLSLDEFIEKNNLSDLKEEERKTKYDEYSRECDLRKKENIAKRYLEEKGLSDVFKRDSKAFDQIKDKVSELNESMSKASEKENLEELKEDLNLDSKFEIELEEENVEEDIKIESEEKVEDAKTESKEEIKSEEKIEEEEDQKEVDVIDEDKGLSKVTPFAKWVEQLGIVIKETYGKGFYDYAKVNDICEYYDIGGSPRMWFKQNYSDIKRVLDKDLPQVFTQAKMRLNKDDQVKFEEIIDKTPFKEDFIETKDFEMDESIKENAFSNALKNSLEEDLKEYDNLEDDLSNTNVLENDELEI